MLNNTEKTIPYKLTPAELENLRLLRRRMNPSRPIQNDEEEMSEEFSAPNSDADRADQKGEKNGS